MPNFDAFFGEPIRVTIPEELANETALLAYLDVSVRELKKIWYFRRRMYHHFSIAKGRKKVRLISAPDQRLKFLQRKLGESLDKIYRPRKPVRRPYDPKGPLLAGTSRTNRSTSPMSVIGLGAAALRARFMGFDPSRSTGPRPLTA